MPLYHLKPFSSPNIWKKIQTLLHMVCKAPKVQALVSCQLCLMSASPCTDHDTPSRLLSLVQFSCSVVSDSLRPHESQHARPPCPSPTPRVHSDSHPSSQWCHPAISSSVVPFSSCLQSFSASASFPVSQLFTPGGQSIGVSASAISPSSEHPGLIYFRMDRLDLLAVQETLKSLIQHHSSKATILRRSAFFIVQLSHPYMTTGKNHSLDRTDICWQSNVSAF